ncbi:MAG: SDR family NAD(P)-dependent oxidoreductase [Armatimonadota bacterium]
MGRLDGKIAIVTGASRGIGAGIARMFAQEGASVVLAARTKERLDALAQEIEANGGSATAVATDVSVTSDIQRMVQTAVDRFGGVDVLVNNAAVTFFSKRMDDPDMEQEFDRVMATNVKSVWMAIHFVLPHMRARGGGSIINITSVHGLASGGHMSAYAASKGALIAGTRALAAELAPCLIRVNCISPGRIWLDEPGEWIARRFGREKHQEFMEHFGDWMVHSRKLQQPLPVEGRPVDIAYCATYLASDESRFCTGANFVVDGGMTAHLADPAFLTWWDHEEYARRRREIREWMEKARREQEASGG